MLEHARTSTDIVLREGLDLTYAPGYLGTRLDGNTDDVMLLTATYQSTDSPLVQAMKNEYMQYSQGAQPQWLARYAEGDRTGTTVSYARYWHGYLVLLKPLLYLRDLSTIRMLNILAQGSLAMALILEAYRCSSGKLAVALGAAIFCLNPVSTALCLQYSSIYLLMLVFSLILLHFRLWEKRNGWLIFLWLGIATAFFDFLTYPVAALGILLGLYSLESHRNWKQKLLDLMRNGLCWVLGYGGMWAGKWVLADLITHQGILADALTQIRYRSGGEISGMEGSETVSLMTVLLRNIGAYTNLATIALIFLVASWLFWQIIVKKKRVSLRMELLLPMLFIALLPFLWYCAVQNHSAVHCWMTHRNLSVTAFALTALAGFSLKQRQ